MLLEWRENQFDVAARGHLGHDPSELGVNVDLGGYYIRYDCRAVIHNGGAGFVAARLDPQNSQTTPSVVAPSLLKSWSVSALKSAL